MRVKIPCIMYDTHLHHTDVKITNMEHNRCKFTTCYDLKQEQH